MDLWEMHREINRAKETIRSADNVVSGIADFLPGRLQHCRAHTLKLLKSELKNFNAHTGQWKQFSE